MDNIEITLEDLNHSFSIPRRKRLKKMYRPTFWELKQKLVSKVSIETNKSIESIESIEWLEEEKDLELVILQKSLTKDFPDKNFEILWPCLSSSVLIQVRDKVEKNEKIEKIEKNEKNEKTENQENTLSKEENRKKIRQKIASLRSGRQSILNTSNSTEAWKMYHQLITRNSGLSSVIPKPDVILEKKEEYEQLIQSPLFQGPKQAGLKQYIETCLVGR